MRTWRKIYASLLDSEQVSHLSDGAVILLVFLIVAQDDSGYYPWTDTKLRRLTVVRPLHTRDDLVTWRDELVTAGIARLEDGGVVLIKGVTLNGIPRKDLRPELYLRNEPVTDPQRDVTISPPRVEKSRVEKSREDKILAPKKQKRITVVDDDFRKTMKERFDQTLTDIDERIDEALGHSAALRWNDMQSYVRGWLRRAAKTEGNNGRIPQGRSSRSQITNTPVGDSALTVKLPDGTTRTFADKWEKQMAWQKGEIP